MRTARFLFFMDTATTEIYTLSLHDALPIWLDRAGIPVLLVGDSLGTTMLGYPDTLSVTMDDMVRHSGAVVRGAPGRSEEHTSELQSRGHLVCRLLLEKKKKQRTRNIDHQLL